jgi:hypothetical protein
MSPLRNNRGLTLIEAAIAMAMLAVIFAGIGYMAKTVPINQRAYHAMQRDENALTLSYVLTNDIKQADEVMLPADVAALGSYPCGQELRLKSTLLDSGTGNFQTRFVKYQIISNEIRRCEVTVDLNNPAAANCTPVANVDNLLSSWNNGRIKVEDHTNANAGYPNGSRFCRGNDWDSDGAISSRERHYIWIQFVLSLNEGPVGNQHLVDEQVYYIEALANVNNVRKPQ